MKSLTAFALLCSTLTAPLLPLTAIAAAPDKTTECNRLIDVANRAVSSVQSATSSSSDSSDYQAMLNVADIADRATSEMQALQLTDEQIRSFQTRFIAMYTDTSKASRDLATAAQAKNETDAQTAYDALVSATDREDPLVNEVNRYCERDRSSAS